MLPALNLCHNALETGGKVAPNNRKTNFTKGKLSVNEVWEFLPTLITYSDTSFLLDDSDFLTYEISNFMKETSPLAVPDYNLPTVYVYVAQDDQPNYNTLVLITNRTSQTRVLYSVSLLTTSDTTGVRKIDTTENPIVLDYFGYEEQIELDIEDLSDKLEYLSDKLERVQKVVLDAERRPTQSELDFLTQPEPPNFNPSAVLNPAINKKPRKPRKKKEQPPPSVQPPSVAELDDDGRPAPPNFNPSDVLNPAINKKPRKPRKKKEQPPPSVAELDDDGRPAPPTPQTTTLVEELADDSDDDGRPAQNEQGAESTDPESDDDKKPASPKNKGKNKMPPTQYEFLQNGRDSGSDSD